MLGTKESRRVLTVWRARLAGHMELARVLAVIAIIGLLPTPGVAAGFCTDTANTLFKACGFMVLDDFWVASARCINEAEQGDRSKCNKAAAQERSDGNQLCRDQLDTRLAACGVIGEGRYDPEFDTQLFDSDFTHLTKPNRFFPLGIGNRWEFKSADELNTIEVLNRTKLIDDVRCIVVTDQVFRNGELVENTDDWFAQAKNGNVWYCGEEVKDFESFDGDVPKLPELVSIDGSFKAGRDLDKPGIIFLDSPQRGDTYIEEFSLANAEDVTEILSTSYAFGRDSVLDQLVPRALADALCHGDCVVTKNYSLLEPGIFARKYYAPGIGVFLEVEPDTQTVSRLTSCNFDPRCATLLQP